MQQDLTSLLTSIISAKILIPDEISRFWVDVNLGWPGRVGAARPTTVPLRAPMWVDMETEAQRGPGLTAELGTSRAPAKPFSSTADALPLHAHTRHLR